ncbi:MAG: glycosyltransferase [Bacteroides fragilis]|nr:glycosyltransferase [Bacteroides fragilis]
MIAKCMIHSRIVLYADTMKPGKHGGYLWNRLLLTWLYKRADAVWVPGEAGKKYFRGCLKGKRPVYCGTYTEDADRKLQKIRELRKTKSELRCMLGFEESDYVFLFVGKLIPTRHVEVLLKCMKMLDDKNKRIKALVIGDGPDEEKVRGYLRTGKNIRWLPRVSLQELEKNYALADAYVHPGEEPYSLALYEAAIAGIPILAAEKVGAAADCLYDGKNGYLLEFCDPSDMCEKMIKAANSEISGNECERVQRFILEKRGIVWSGEQLMKACSLN